MANHYGDIIARFDLASRDSGDERAFVTLSFAQSLDGSVALRPGERTHFSNDASLEMTHALRARHDAVIVGVGTVLVDDPRLSVRLEGDAKQPLRVVLDRELRTPTDAQLFRSAGGPVHVLCDEGASKAREEALLEAGATVWRWPGPEFEPCRLCVRLRDLGVRTAMVEGGAAIISQVLDSGCADYAVLTIVPVLTAHRDTVRYDQGSREHAYDLGHCHRTLIDGDVVLDGPLR